MLKEIDDGDWAEAFGEGHDISEKPTPAICCPTISVEGVSREAVEEIVALENGENDGPDWVGLFRLKDGRFVTVEGGCDYTGWDCQASTMVQVADTKENAIRYAMSDSARDRLGLKLGPEQEKMPEIKGVARDPR